MDKVEAEEEVGGGAPIGEHGALTKIRRQQLHSGVGSKWRCSGEEEELIEGGCIRGKSMGETEKKKIRAITLYITITSWLNQF